MEKKLISMVEFVLATGETSVNKISDWEVWTSIHDYANFLNTTLNLSMFVPCVKVGDKWEVLEEPKEPESPYNDKNCDVWFQFECSQFKYQTAKDNVIFEGFDSTKRNDYFIVSHDEIEIWLSWTDRKVEDLLLGYKNITLTKKGVEVSGLNR